MRENNQKAGKTWTYTYDSAGNIVSKKEYNYSTGTLGSAIDTVTYTYGNSNWGDQLTSYDGTAITYDAIGNPLNWTDGRTFTWSGRQLSSIIYDDSITTYTYNADGIRTKKHWVDDIGTEETTVYILDGNNTLIGEEYTYSQYGQVINSHKISYFYDESGSPVYCTCDGTTYYYVKNQQGDITGLMLADGTIVVTYEYDAWGNLIDSMFVRAHRVVYIMNTYTYRGYQYDRDTGFYYLQSRYYDPEVGRFLNADDTNYLGVTGTTLGYNLYAYCENNAVNNIDPYGTLSLGKHWWNKTSFVANTIDIIIIAIPALIALSNFLKAAKIATALAKTAAQMSRKALRAAFVEMGLKLATATGWTALKTIGGAVYDIIETVTGYTLGNVIANAVDKLDGRKDNYIYA